MTGSETAMSDDDGQFARAIEEYLRRRESHDLLARVDAALEAGIRYSFGLAANLIV